MNILVFTQNGCNPCTMVKNYLTDQEIEFKAINVSENPQSGEEYGIMGTPVSILVDEDGEEVTRVVGFNPDQLDILASQL